MNTFKYYLEDAREGIRKNLRAVIATVLLIFISLSITSSLFILKNGADELVSFLNSQVKLKVLVDNKLDVRQVDEILKKSEYIESTTIETKEETLKRLEGFFEGKQHLLFAFDESELPNSILIEVKQKTNMDVVAKELESVNGIQKVIYPQEFAKVVVTFSEKVNQYGIILLSIFVLSSFLTVSIAISLSMYQRQKEIRVKMLIGAKESHIKGQFIFEGALIGFISSILSCFVVYSLFEFVLYKLQVQYSFLFKFGPNVLNTTLIGIIISGTLIGLVGSWLSTRRMIENA